MSTPIIPEPADPTDPVVTETPAPVPAPTSANPDPITGEPGAHPVGVGVGALGAGVAGAAIGAIGGPIGMLIGAAIGAVAGGLAGKEVATSDAPLADDAAAGTAEPVSTLPDDMPTPVSMTSVPGEGLRALDGAGFPDGAGHQSAGTTGAAAAAAMGNLEDDALPSPTDAATPHETAFQTPSVSETEPLADAVMPRNGEEAVQVSAYYHYVDRTSTGESGDALGDWLAAEREMMLG